MAYDYRGQPPDSAPYPQHDYAPDPRNYQTLAPPYQAEDVRSRSRASSSARATYDNYQTSSQPIHDAVTNVFDSTSGAASRLPPDIVKQLAEDIKGEVFSALHAQGLLSPVAQQPPPQHTNFAPTSPLPPQPQPYAPHSPTSTDTTKSVPSRPVHTPPSPARRSSNDSSLPDHHLLHEHHHPPVDGTREDLSGRYGDRTEDAPLRRTETNSFSSRQVPRDRSAEDSDSSRRRPPLVSRQKTDEEETVVEKMWQPLFGGDGKPTPRLGQFLRGLALHLVEDYDPKKSLVISPTKMRRFYEETKLDDETYPWQTIFRLNHIVIAKIYRDLRCEHHLVQDHHGEVPHIPCLTPEGFERWMTYMIQAHPTHEFCRLAIAVREMPISNADDRKERLPKELSRRLFPKQDDIQVRQRCAAALSADGQVPLPKHTQLPPPPNQPPPSDLQRERSSTTDNHRATYVRGSDSAIHDSSGDELPPRVQIERERKPYVAKEGTGKIYDDTSNATSAATLRPVVSESGIKPRAASTVADSSYQSSSTRSSDADGPTGSHHHRTYSKTSSRRQRSPTTSNTYVKSDSNLVDIPPSYYTSNIYPDPLDSDPRYAKDAERDRRSARDTVSERDRKSDRDRDREKKERDRRDRDKYPSEAELDYARRRAEEEDALYRTASRHEDEYFRRGVAAGSNGYADYQYPPPGPGERRYG